RGAATLAEAQPGEITFVNSAERSHLLKRSAASAVVVPRGLAIPGCLPSIKVDDATEAFTAIVKHFCPPRPVGRSGVSTQAFISATAKLADDVDVHAGATIGDDVEIGIGSTIHTGARILAGCKLGEQVTIFPNAVLYENTLVGPRSIIHANAVLGA